MRSRRFLVLGFLVVLALCAVAPAEQKVLYEKESPYNVIVVTEDDQGLRTLWFEKDGVRQSVVKVGDPDHLELAYTRVMPVGLALVEKPQRVLIVGLGGGAIPGFLHKHYPRMTIDAVDIDPDVVDVARRFFGFREDATMRAYVDDGRRFIERCRDPYDVIFLDAYGSENIPYQLATQEFLATVRRALAPGGVVVANVWDRTSNPLYDSMVRTYQEVFADLHVLDVRWTGNQILLALGEKQPIRQDGLALRATAISRQENFPFDMGEFVIFGYRHPSKENARGRVLRDADESGKD